MTSLILTFRSYKGLSSSRVHSSRGRPQVEELHLMNTH